LQFGETGICRVNSNRAAFVGKGDLVNSRKFFTPSNVTLIVAILAVAQMGCVSDAEDAVDSEAKSDTEDVVDSEGQLAPGYSHPQSFSFGH